MIHAVFTENLPEDILIKRRSLCSLTEATIIQKKDTQTYSELVFRFICAIFGRRKQKNDFYK